MLGEWMNRSVTLLLAGVAVMGCAWAQGQQTSRPMFLTGKVVLSDGGPPPVPVLIEMDCQGQRQPQGHTDAIGEFGFQIGLNRNRTPNDASQRSPSTSDSFGGLIAYRQQVLGAAEYSIFGCGIEAVLDGYSSSAIEMSGRRAADSSEVGTIVLTRLGETGLQAVGIASPKAPENARRAYERGLQQTGRQRFANAEEQLNRAIEIYPDYAEAWHELGVVQQAQGKTEEAHESFEKAIAVDSEFVPPYLHLSLTAARAGDWQETADYSDTLIQVDPANPEGFYYNAVAYFNLGNFDRAQASAEQAVELDTEHQIPLAEQLLALLLARQGDFESAAAHMRNFILHALPSYRLGGARRRLAEIERGVVPNVVTDPTR